MPRRAFLDTSDDGSCRLQRETIGERMSNMLYKLDVPYREKDQAKRRGARWNGTERTWFYVGDHLPEGLRQWFRGDPAGIPEPPEGTSVSGPGGTGPQAGSSEGADFRSVSEVSRMISHRIDGAPEFRHMRIRGEITNFSGNRRGGHYYFSIKDEYAVLRCVMYRSVAEARLKFSLENGLMVQIIGSLNYYGPGGSISLIVDQMAPDGAGAAALALKLLRERLRREGLFDQEHKKPIPPYPEAVGIITSRDGQAIRDICSKARERNPYVRLVLYPVNVQGQNAARTILAGIRFMDRQGLDTIIIGRGGGSDEELNVYNDEQIVRAVFEAKTPIISAVGHTGNRTVIDEVADRVAITPTEAAEIAVPDIMKDIRRLEELRQSIYHRMRSLLLLRFRDLEGKVNALKSSHPRRVIAVKGERLKALSDSIRTNMTSQLKTRRHQYEVLVARLHGLSPTSRLVDGFGYISHDDKPVTTVAGLKPGDHIKVRIHDGEIRSDVTEVVEKSIAE